MKRTMGIVVAILFAASAADAAPTAREKIAALRYLVGNWNCVHTVGTFTGKYATTYSTALGDLWLKQTYEFPATQEGDKMEPARQAETLMGYDERRQAWVRFFAMSNGQYFPIRMTETERGWDWKYVSFFKLKNPESPGSDATFTRKSDTEYTIDGPSYPENGTVVTEHHACKKT